MDNLRDDTLPDTDRLFSAFFDAIRTEEFFEPTDFVFVGLSGFAA